MSWTRLAKLLRTSSLDRETKLTLIDLLAIIYDPKLEEEIFGFVFAWEEAEASTHKELIDGIKQIMDEYEQERANLERSAHTTALSVADDLNRQQRLNTLRKTIHEL